MNGRVLAVVLVLVALLTVAVAGTGIYRAGVARGLAESGRIAPPPPGTAPYPYYAPYWHPGPFGFGFFGLLFPLLFLFLAFALLRGLFWGRRWPGPHSWRGGPVPPMFEEWHRRVHESAGGPGQGGAASGQGQRV
jgi:hypothetical protein